MRQFFIRMILCVLPGMMLFSGCRSVSQGDTPDVFGQAVDCIREGRASCLLVSGGRMIEQRQGRGLNPLLEMYDAHREEFAGGMIADKVIGRAAAFILIQGKAVRVYGRLMSEDAKKMLEASGIAVTCDLLVPKILNRRQDGLCPLEQSVAGIENGEEAMTAIRRRLRELGVR